MSSSEEPTSGNQRSYLDKLSDRIWPHYDKITSYMKASGSPDAAVFVAACVVFGACLIAGYAYLGFAFGLLVVVAYTGLSIGRMVLAVRGKEQIFDALVDQQLGAPKNNPGKN